MPNGVDWGGWDGGGGGPLAEFLFPFEKGGGNGGGGIEEDGAFDDFGGEWDEEGKNVTYGGGGGGGEPLVEPFFPFKRGGHGGGGGGGIQDGVFDDFGKVWDEEGKYVTHWGGGGGGGGGGLKLFWQSEEDSNVCFSCLLLHGVWGHWVCEESWVELVSGVARFIGKPVELAIEGLTCDYCRGKMSYVSLWPPAEAFEGLTFDEFEVVGLGGCWGWTAF